MVVEKKFSEYLVRKQATANDDFVPSRIKVEKQDFLDVINRIKDSAMVNQQSIKKNKEEMLREKTSIERSLDMKDTYRFTDAAK